MNRILSSLLLASAGVIVLAQSNPYAEVNASVVKLDGGFLLVGTKDGSITGFNPRTEQRLFHLRGTSKSPVRDVVWIDHRPWWITEGSPFLHGSSFDAKPLNIDLTDLKLGSLKRLGAWQGMLVIHTETQVRFMEPGTRHILKAAEVLPKDVAEAAEQGELLEWWQDKQGILVTLRRYGNRTSAEEPGAIKDVALMNGWSFDVNNRAKLLGGYTASIVPFRETAGPRVSIKLGESSIDMPRGAADVGNVRLGPDGIVALGKTTLLVASLSADNWIPSTVSPSFPPSYSQTSAFGGNSVWWAEGHKVFRANVKDGSTEVFVPRWRTEKIVSVAADEKGAFVVTENGAVTRIDSTKDHVDSPFVRRLMKR